MLTEKVGIAYTCPNCGKHYELYNGDEPISAKRMKQLQEAVDAQYKLGHCKFCVRKNPDIPTTAEMDGLLTIEDIRQRHEIVRQCVNCSRWTQMTHESLSDPSTPCTGIVNGQQYRDGRGKIVEGCGQINYDTDSSGMKSLRSYKPEVDNKRKVKAKKKR